MTDPDDSAMPAVRNIYQSQLPASERKPTAWLDDIVHRADYTVMIAEYQQTAIGFAILFTPIDPQNTSLLEYLAINPALQGRGIGTLLVRTLVNTRPMLAEVEAGDEMHAVRRREFYHRMGFRRLSGLAYLLPLPQAPPMELMLINGPLELTHNTMARWLTDIYNFVYGCSPEDPRLKSMLSLLPSKI